MKPWKKFLLVFAAIIVIIFITAVIIVRNISRRALPDYNRDIVITGLHAPVEVIRDEYAIPHIYAADEHDLYMVTGYILAQDRLWQMDLLRRITQGRLSEIFGKDYTGTDLLLRSLRFGEKSAAIFETTEPGVQEALISFSEGVNQYILQNSKKLPPEFSLLGYDPEPWEPVHSLNLIGYMAWDLKTGWSEIMLLNLKEVIDSIRYSQLMPDSGDGQSVIYKTAGEKVTLSSLPEMLLENSGLRRLRADVFEGSNNWAVTGDRSVSGMPLLANDMHLTLNIPGIWYQIHQNVPGKLNVSGVILPGSPVIICGHNDSIAWGMTNTTVDNVDFYEERVNPSNPLQYEYMGEWKDMEISAEVIRISDGTQIEDTIYYTWRGPVISDMAAPDGGVVTMHWTGAEMSNEMKSCYLLNRASGWDDFREALTTFVSVSQNVVYADVTGNIGIYCASGIPIRKRDEAAAILPGWTDEYNWQGLVPFEELPYTFNPPEGIVASANNRTAPQDYPYHIGTWYSLPARYDRIMEMISSGGKMSVDKFRDIQLDRHSKLAERYMPVILEALRQYEFTDEKEKQAVQLLADWDYEMTAGDPAPLLFETAYRSIMQSVFSDETGNSGYEAFGGSNISHIAMYRLMEKDGSPWFDDVTTPETETRDDMIVAGFRKAVSSVSVILGDKPSEWEWGDLHPFTLAHPLSTVRALDIIFNLNRGPFEVGGSFHTVSPFSYEISDGIYNSDHGSSQRHIYDVGNWDNSITVIPTGNSGIPASKHYCDQTHLYINGQYHAENFSRAKVEEKAEYRMQFLQGD